MAHQPKPTEKQITTHFLYGPSTLKMNKSVANKFSLKIPRDATSCFSFDSEASEYQVQGTLVVRNQTKRQMPKGEATYHEEQQEQVHLFRHQTIPGLNYPVELEEHLFRQFLIFFRSFPCLNLKKYNIKQHNTAYKGNISNVYQ